MKLDQDHVTNDPGESYSGSDLQKVLDSSSYAIAVTGALICQMAFRSPSFFVQAFLSLLAVGVFLLGCHIATKNKSVFFYRLFVPQGIASLAALAVYSLSERQPDLHFDWLLVPFFAIAIVGTLAVLSKRDSLRLVHFALATVPAFFSNWGQY